MARMEKVDPKQQYVFLLMALIPGILFFLKVLAPHQAALLVLVCYFMSRVHTHRLQKQLREEEEAEERRKEEEAAAIAALPAKKRRSILKGIAKRQEALAAGETEENGEEEEEDDAAGEDTKEE